MGFKKIRACDVVRGKTVPYPFDGEGGRPHFPGEPVAHLEYLGESNAGFWSDQIARAKASVPTPKAISERTILEARTRNRAILAKHCVRKLEALHDDGSVATDADIPEFVEDLPADAVDKLREFATNIENFRERVLESDAKTLAEK